MKIITPREIRSTWQDKFEWDRFNVINKEQQHYLPKNDRNSAIVIEDGSEVLKITAIAEAVRGQFYDNEGNKWTEQPYTSAVFISQGIESIRTGQYVEFICTLPLGDFAFGAGWLLRTDPVWAKSEIDIFETVGNLIGGEYHTAMHSHTAEGGTYEKHGGSIATKADLSDYNRYGAYIGMDEVTYYFNRKEVAKVKLHDHEKNLEWYMLLNLAIAGEGTWASNNNPGPAIPNDRVMRCKGIVILEGKPSPSGIDPVEQTGVTPAAPVTAPVDYVKDQPAEAALPLNATDVRSLANALLTTRYEGSTTVAKVLYDIARKFGGKL